MDKGIDGENLIFLISQPRSGSTLLQFLLAGNSEIATTSEPWIALHPIFALKESGLDSVYGANLSRDALFDFLERNGLNIKYYKKQISYFLASLYNQALIHHKKKYFLDKTPRYYHIVDELLELFPKAKFIILFRNPMAVLSSIIDTWVKDDLSVMAYYIEDLIVAPFKLVDCVMKYPERCYKIQYEDIVSNVKKEIKMLCNFIDIKFSKNMIHYEDRIGSINSFGDPTGIYQDFRPNIKSLNKWEKTINEKKVKLFATSYLKVLGPDIIKKMGYSYNDIKFLLAVPKENEDNKILWQTLLKINNEFYDREDRKRVAFSLLNAEILKNDITKEYNNWFDSVSKIMISQLKKDKISDQVQIETLKINIDNMKNTLSWRLTSPIRNSNILRKILKLLIK